jgi:DNA-directed RNA polymerase subunit RPC12/RpoP
MPRYTCIECGRRFNSKMYYSKCPTCRDNERITGKLPLYKDPKVMDYIKKYRNFHLDNELANLRQLNEERREQGLPYLSYGKYQVQKYIERTNKNRKMQD